MKAATDRAVDNVNNASRPGQTNNNERRAEQSIPPAADIRLPMAAVIGQGRSGQGRRCGVG